jgi:hypothetical protein
MDYIENTTYNSTSIVERGSLPSKGRFLFVFFLVVAQQRAYMRQDVWKWVLLFDERRDWTSCDGPNSSSASQSLHVKTNRVSETSLAIIEDRQSRGTQRSYEQVQAPRIRTSLIYLYFRVGNFGEEKSLAFNQPSSVRLPALSMAYPEQHRYICRSEWPRGLRSPEHWDRGMSVCR